MISEQLWDAEDLPDGRMKRGLPNGRGHAALLVARRIRFTRAQPS